MRNVHKGEREGKRVEKNEREERERHYKDLEQCSIRLGRVDLRVIESKCLGNGFILKY